MLSPMQVWAMSSIPELRREHIMSAMVAPLRQGMRKGEKEVRIPFNYLKLVCTLDTPLTEEELNEIQNCLIEVGWHVHLENPEKLSGEFVFCDLTQL